MPVNNIDILIAALPKGRVVCFNPTLHYPYLTDASSAIGGEPAVCVYPESQAEIQVVLEYANRTRTPVVVRGAGTGKTGGAVPLKGSILVSIEKLNKILEIDTQNRMAVVEPGVILKTFQDAVEAKGLFYPPDPASLMDCTIGGNVAVNAGGPRCLKYGVTGHYVAGLEGVWANGTPFKLGGKLYKNVSGYDLMRLLIGSEGTLGILTRITLKLLTKPAIQADCHVVFPTAGEAITALHTIQNSGVTPAAAELMDTLCIQAVEQYQNKSIPYADKTHCIFQLDGESKAQIESQLVTIEALCKQAGAIAITCASEKNEALWQMRRSISTALTAFSANKESHDITVPIAKLQDTMTYLSGFNKNPHICVLGYGHMGDGNLHVNLLNKGLEIHEWNILKTRLENDLFHYAVNAGGTISGEHGIGLTKKPFMALMYDAAHLHFLKQIKQVFDPNGILNPQKIID